MDTLCEAGKFVDPCGTKGYAAPEIICAYKANTKIEADMSFDIFSFGRTVRNILTVKVCIK